MKRLNRLLRCAASRFWRCCDGSVTIEFIIWVPAFMTIILLAADTSLIFMRQSNFWHVSSDTARIVARHGMTAEEAVIYAQEQSTFLGYVPEVSVSMNDDQVAVTITGLARKMAPLGILGLVVKNKLSAKVVHTLEPL